MGMKEKITVLRHKIEASFHEIEEIATKIEEMEEKSLSVLTNESEMVSMLIKIHEKANHCICIGLTDLDNKIKEAEYNALNFFGKKCPYCGNGVFDGHIRNKINIDHFWPIAKGGQHVPWNILPICGRCNKKKRDKFPFEFIEPDKYVAILNYLESVRNKYNNESQTCVEIIAKIKGSILNEGALPTHEIIKRLYNILEIHGLPFHNVYVFKKFRLDEDILSGFIQTYCSVTEKERVQFSELYPVFETWWLANRSDELPKRKKFSQVLARQFKRENRGGTIYFSGLRLKSVSEMENKKVSNSKE